MNLKTLPRMLLGLVIVLTGLIVFACGGKTTPAATTTIAYQNTTGVKVMNWSKPPAMQIDKNKKYTATIQTEKGNLVIDLFAKDVPITVNNFVFLVGQGFYDGTTFHRVLPGFMAQGGDPTGTGMGSPGYKFANEITAHKHVAGAVSMANSGPNTNGSQFFITYVATPWLDGGYNVFGQLTQGMDVLNKLTPRDLDKNPNFTGDKIIKVTITVQ